jgi:hypothetical protein
MDATASRAATAAMGPALAVACSITVPAGEGSGQRSADDAESAARGHAVRGRGS